MTERLREIADRADMIVNGYSFTRDGDTIRVLNLNKPGKATVFRMNGEMLETSMDDIEIRIVQEYLAKNHRFMEA